MEQAKYDVFISYSRKDTNVADKIAKAFEDAGITYFIDRQGIGGGMEFPAVLAKAIRDSKVFLFLASKNSYESKFTQSEIVYAFNKKHKQDIIPYIIDGSTLPEELEFTFSAINWRNIKQHPIETTLVDDVLLKVGKIRKENRQSDADGLNIQELRHMPSQDKWNQLAKILFTGKGLAITVFSMAIVLLLWMFFVSKAYLQAHFDTIEIIYFLALLVSFCFFMVGIIRPASVCLTNRKEALKFYLTSLFAIFIAFCMIVNNESLKKDNSKGISDSLLVESSCQMIDLGLPSGTLWGDRNIGAKTPTDFGDLYAWGEVNTKEDYSSNTYVEQLKPRQILMGAKRDVATAILGEEWSMPTEEQFEELLSECLWSWKKINGHNGYEIIGKSGKSIFLPAGGWSCDTTVQYRNKYGYYWTSERSSQSQFARSLQFPKNGKGIVGNGYLYVGRSVRAVHDSMEAVAE